MNRQQFEQRLGLVPRMFKAIANIRSEKNSRANISTEKVGLLVRRVSELPLKLSLVLSSLLIGHSTAQSKTNVITYHNDNARTGQNLNETILTPSNVNSTTFGKLLIDSVDGKVDAQPLYMSGVAIPGQGTRNVLFVATEHDSVYAFDADTGRTLWHVSLLKSGETPSDPRSCGQVTPEIGITATPVIDSNSGPHGTIYVVAMSKDASGNYFQRLHALDITTGAQEFGQALEIQATFPGTGDNSSGGKVVFDPKQYEERAGLLLLNGVVYTTWTSHCDIRPYTGWVMGYNESSLAQVSVLNLTPNGNEGSIWASGAGPAADANGNIYFLAANGTFETTLDTNGFPNKGDFGNSFLKLSTSNKKLAVADYFSMFNTLAESNSDQDLGSGGALVLPEMMNSLGQIKHLAVGAGKDKNIYLVDRDQMGKFNPNNNNNIYQELPGALSGGEFAMPAYFKNTLYYGAVGDSIKAFEFANAKLSTSPSSQTSNNFGYPGTTPSISASGTSNGIVWAAENGSTAVLHAYDATNLSHELYNSNLAASSRDQFGTGNKFITPTIANGKVYVGTTNGVGVFGLLNQPILYEPEFLPVASSGPKHRVIFWNGFTDTEGTILDSTAVGDNLTYTLNVAKPGTYDVKVAVKKINTRAIWQLSINGKNQGSPQDEYAPSDTWAEFALGTVTFSSTGNQTFKFTVIGKNANSTDYKMAFDYIKLTPH